MGGKPSKDNQGQGLVPRDGTDEIEVHPKKLVTQEQFDELLHKFSLLEQLMQQDKSKISDLESSVTQYQEDKRQLRQSFVAIDSEVKRDKEDIERLENNLTARVEQQTREKYELLDQMLTSQAQRIEQLIRDQEANSSNIKAEYGQLDRKLTSSLQVDRNEVERLVSSKLTEETKEKGDFEKRVSLMIDQNSLSVSMVRDELEDRRRETQEVRESVEREKQSLLQEIARVQAVMQEAKQTADSEQSLSEQLIATKEQLEVRLSEEERARAQLESIMKTMLDNKVSENQKQFLEQIKAQEDVIQTQVLRMEQLKGSMDSSVKEEQARVREEVERRISDMSVSYQEQLSTKETEKKDITRKLSQDFETRLQEMQSSLSQDIQAHRSKTETILEDSDQDKKSVQARLEAMEENLLQKFQDASRESQLTVDTQLTSLREELASSLSRAQLSEGEVAGLSEQLAEVRGDLSVVRDSQTGIRDDVELMQNQLSNEVDAKIQLIIEAKITDVSSELDEKYNRSEQNCAQLAEKLDALGTSSDPSQEPMQLQYMQKTSEEIGLLLDRMEETASQLQSVSDNTIEMDRRQQTSQTDIQQNQEQLQTAQSDLLMLRSENSELTQKYESQAAELARVVAENSKLQQSIDSAMRILEEQSKDIEQLKSQTGQNRSVSEIPPESPLEKMEEMETVIKKQGHGINDLEFLIDEARDLAKSSAENVDNAINKFDTKLEDETAKLRTDLESLRTELTKKMSEITAEKPEQP